MSLEVIHQFQGYSNASHIHLYSAAIYKISTGTPATRGPSATAGLLGLLLLSNAVLVYSVIAVQTGLLNRLNVHEVVPIPSLRFVVELLRTC